MNKSLDITRMRFAGKVLGETLHYLENSYIKEGVTAREISKKAEELIRSYKGCKPAFLGYHGFPAAACVSINEQAVHGIPNDRVIKSGDIVSVDCGVRYRNHFSDACRTVIVGEVPPKIKKMVEVTKEATYLGIEQAIVGNTVGDISFAVQRFVERNGFKVSPVFVGHGIGRELHGDPPVPNCGLPGSGPELVSGQCLAIEPVVFNGQPFAEAGEDGWTVVSTTGCLSAHYEETILIREEGSPEILTRLA